MTAVNQWGTFAQNPVTIKAAKVVKECKVKNPWAAGELLTAKKGDYLVKNLLSGEVYPIEPNVMAEKYKQVGKNLFEKIADGTKTILAKLPDSATVNSREGKEVTERVLENGKKMFGLIANDGLKESYVIPADYFTKAYRAVDDVAKNIMEVTLKTLKSIK